MKLLYLINLVNYLPLLTSLTPNSVLSRSIDQTKLSINSRETRMIHADFVDSNEEIPWYFSIRMNFYGRAKDQTVKTMCGAVLIHPNALLTAAHCLLVKTRTKNGINPRPVDKIEIFRNDGMAPWNRESDFVSTNYVFGDDYNFYAQNSVEGNDIAMIFFDSNKKLGESDTALLPKSVNPVMLLRADLSASLPENDYTFRALGYGMVEDIYSYHYKAKKHSKKFKYIDVNVVSDQSCNELNLLEIQDTHFCVIATEAFRESMRKKKGQLKFTERRDWRHTGRVNTRVALPHVCSGDSGSPVMRLNTETNQVTREVYALTSMHIGQCYNDQLSGIVTDLSSEKISTWVNKTYQNYGASPMNEIPNCADWQVNIKKTKNTQKNKFDWEDEKVLPDWQIEVTDA